MKTRHDDLTDIDNNFWQSSNFFLYTKCIIYTNGDGLVQGDVRKESFNTEGCHIDLVFCF